MTDLTDLYAIKREVLILANCLGPEEAPTRRDVQTSLRDTVARICSGPDANPVVMALIAVTLAEALEA